MYGTMAAIFHKIPTRPMATHKILCHCGLHSNLDPIEDTIHRAVHEISNTFLSKGDNPLQYTIHNTVKMHEINDITSNHVILHKLPSRLMQQHIIIHYIQHCPKYGNIPKHVGWPKSPQLHDSHVITVQFS